MFNRGLVSNGSFDCLVASCYEHGNEILAYVKGGRFINYPSDSQVVEVSSACELVC
jgi:hypothetical protein